MLRMIITALGIAKSSITLNWSAAPMATASSFKHRLASIQGDRQIQVLLLGCIIDHITHTAFNSLT
jgi:hypothetical protein